MDKHLSQIVAGGSKAVHITSANQEYQLCKLCDLHHAMDAMHNGTFAMATTDKLNTRLNKIVIGWIENTFYGLSFVAVTS